jgi:diguanylate cyclase (GGDEF)-like protein/PAS domain S-box-containing protein
MTQTADPRGILHQQIDLTACDQEPIHTPNAIQPQGALLVVRRDDLTVAHASANLADWLGLSAQAMLGRSLHEVIGEEGGYSIQSALADARFGFCNVIPVSPPTALLPLQMTAHPIGDSICIELEAASPDAERGTAIQRALAIMQALHAASSQRELCDIVVAKLRQLTGYDRVMVYRFDREGNGEVIAEAREHDLEPYLGLRYPASDIPRQARRMYLTQRVRAIADVDYVPVPLLSDVAPGPVAPLDMTFCALRSVSPVHLEYMRNMGTRASLGLSLIINNSLWGMLVCHHRAPLVITPDLRAQCDLIGQLVSLLLGSLGELEAYADQLRRQRMFQEVATSLGNAGSVMDAMATSGDALLSLLDAAGAVIRVDERRLILGVTPPIEAAERAIAALSAASEGGLVAVDELQEVLPDWVCHCATGSGALLLPLPPNVNDAIIWFRPEVERMVAWAGDPHKPTSTNVTGRLSPRHSFAAWRELVRGHSEPWQEADRATARELQHTVAIATARQAEAELAKLRYYDALTGLPNRRLFQERLAAQGAGPDTALLYLDLDRFKAVNDTLGHGAGDALLCAVAQRLAGCSREGDLVVRLGGDEFAIVQENGEQPLRATAVAQRVIDNLNQPFDIDGQQVGIGVSVGIALGQAGMTPGTLLQNADQALYQAKTGGRGTFKVFRADLQRLAPPDPALQGRQERGRSTSLHTVEQGALDAGALAVPVEPAATPKLIKTLEHLLNGVPHPILVKDRAHRWLVANDAMWALMGRAREDMLALTDYDLVPTAQADGYWAIDDAVFETGVEQEVEEDLTTADGKIRRLKTLKRLVTLPDSQGDEAFLVISITDITREHDIDRALQESQEDHRYSLELSPEISWTADPTGRILEVGPRWYKLTGLTREEFQDKGWIHAVHPEDAVATQYRLALGNLTGQHIDLECRFRLLDGTFRWFQLRATARCDTEGRVIRWYGTTTDINERKLGEIALHDSEIRFRAMADDAPVVVRVTDPAGACTFMNRRWHEITGQADESASGGGWLGCVHPDDRDAVELAFTAAIEQQMTLSIEYRLLPTRGEVLWVVDNSAPRIAPDGSFLGHVGSVLDITERRKTDVALRESEEFAHSILENSPDCIRVHDRKGRLLFMNAAGRRMLAVDDFAQVKGQAWETFWTIEGVPKVRAATLEALDGRVGHFTAQSALGGATTWWEGKICPVSTGEGKSNRFLSILRDVTQSKHAQGEVQALAARLSAVLESTTDCIVVLDQERRVTYVNQHAVRMLPGKLAVGISLRDAFPEEVGGAFDARIRQAVVEQVSVVFEAYLLASDLWLEVHAFPTSTGLSLFFRDVTQRRRVDEERRRSQEQLAHMARHDALTGLPNRFLFRERLERGLAEAAPGAAVAVLCLDLDGFKVINDTMGHPAGDALLQQVAERLRGSVRSGDISARIGGDEFAVIQANIRQPEDVVQLAGRLIAAFGEPFELNDQLVAVGASLGIAMLEPGLLAEDLIKRADIALYHAKKNGRGSYRIFEAGMDATLRQRQAIKLELASAIAQGNLELHYQPQVDLRSGEVKGFEALLRWRHPDRGLIPPADFISVAEETGLIRVIGEWVLREACRQATRWPEGISVAVNLSAVQFWSGDLVHLAAAALAEAGLPAARLELEITESILLQESESVSATLHALRKLGIRIALDDFGTGYSSLSYLRSFPFDKIKIDRAFVSDLPNGREAGAIVRAVVSLAESLGMVTTAEGVETSSQLESVRGMGVNQVQGFLLSRAVPADEVPRLIQHLRGVLATRSVVEF